MIYNDLFDPFLQIAVQHRMSLMASAVFLYIWNIRKYLADMYFIHWWHCCDKEAAEGIMLQFVD